MSEPELTLLPCPLCGIGNLRISEPDDQNIWVSCNGCGCSGPMDITTRLAAKKWNRRPSPTGTSFDDVVESLQGRSKTRYPALVAAVVRAAHASGAFNPGMISVFVADVEKGLASDGNNNNP